MSIQQVLQARLAERRQQHLYRQRRLSQSAQDRSVVVNGQTCVSFCSNDYLGLANHPEVKRSFQQAVDQWGVGSGASHLITGHSQAHHALEEALAEYTGRESALLFSTGYMANLGVITTLLDRKDTAMCDRLNHASLLDAVTLSGAKLRRYLHNDSLALHNKLLCDRGQHRLIVTDGVFSMDGDIAPLADLVRIADKHQAWLMVDDAHGMGVLGEGGRGSLSHFNLKAAQVPVLMGTLGKSFGVFGAFVAGSHALIENMIQFARSYVYTTALPPAIAVASLTSLRLMQAETWRQEKLQCLIDQFKQGAEQLGLRLMPSDTPIQPLVIGDAQAVLKIAEQAQQAGFLLSAIRAPTVPKGSERLRITLSANHTENDIDQLLVFLEKTVLPAVLAHNDSEHNRAALR